MSGFSGVPIPLCLRAYAPSASPDQVRLRIGGPWWSQSLTGDSSLLVQTQVHLGAACHTTFAYFMAT